MKKILSILALLFFLSACNFLPKAENGPPKNPDPNHTHADFAIWIGGTKLDFSDEKYMSGADTAEENSAEGEEHGHLHDYLHLHDGNGDILHRHKPELSFGEFLESLGLTMTPECLKLDAGEEYCSNGKSSWRMFVNEQERPFDPDYVFEDLDRILLTYSPSDTAYLEQLKELTNDACMYSKTCPERGTPPIENCIADPEIPCVAQ